MKTDEGVSPNQRGRARAMRHAPTDAELGLWRLLRDRRLSGLKFRRQVPVGPYIVDFLCVASRLIVEADGSAACGERPRRSPRCLSRSSGLESAAISWNHEVTRNQESVMETILARAASLSDPHPAGFAGHLLPEGEGAQ